MKEVSAGGVVYRRVDEEIEVLLIRDRFGYWTLPKGKQEPGETLVQTASREVKEETQIETESDRFIAVTYYTYDHPQKGKVEKEVHYYLMRALSEESQPQLSEIAQTAWFSAKKAFQQVCEQGYANNRPILRQAYALLGIALP